MTIILIFTVITTPVAANTYWQVLLNIPLLKSPLFKSIAGVSITTVIIILEVIAVWLCFSMASNHKQERDKEARALSQIALLPGNSHTPSGNSNNPQSRVLSLRHLLLFGIIGVVVIAVPVAFIYQNQGSPTTYLLVYGSPTLSDPLRQSGHWYESNRDFSGGNCQFSDANFHVRETQSQNIFLCPSTSTYADFAFEVQMSVMQGDCGGVDVRSDTVNGTGYIFSICQDGTYTLMKDTVPKTPTTLLANSHSSLIHTGLKQSNLVAIAVQGSSITLYVNRQQMKSVQDESYTEGYIALLALSEDSSTEVTYANAKIWKL